MSHLFLSGPPAAAAPAESAKADWQGSPRLLQSSPAPDRPQMVAFLGTHMEALEARLRAIDASLPCEGCGEIDLLAVDGGNRLAIVDVGTRPDDGLLVRGLAHYDWVTRNVPFLKRVYQESTVDFSLRPRVFLVAPRLSWTVRCAARQIGAPRISWCTYRAVTIEGGVGIVVDSDRVGA